MQDAPALLAPVGVGQGAKLGHVIEIALSDFLEVLESGLLFRRQFGLRVGFRQLVDFARQLIELVVVLGRLGLSFRLQQVSGGNAHSLSGHTDLREYLQGNRAVVKQGLIGGRHPARIQHARGTDHEWNEDSQEYSGQDSCLQAHQRRFH